jgi:hypothetical protein
MPISEILGAVSALKATAQSLSTVAEIANNVKVQHVVIEFQSKIIDLQEKFLRFQNEFETLEKANHDLDSKLKDKIQWEIIAGCYHLQEVAPGVIVYAQNDQVGGVKHSICPNCYEGKKFSILQRMNTGQPGLKCPSCKLQLFLEEPGQAWGAAIG